jgi:CHAT domain-containing protein/Tfp pilus assembly protein PilF
MWHLPRRRRLALVSALGLFLLAAVAGAVRWALPTFDDPDRASLHALVGRFYEAQASQDIDEFVSLWDPAAPDLPERRTRLRRLLAIYGRIAVGEIAVNDLVVTDVGATIEVDVELRAFEPKTGLLAEGFGQLRRVVECVWRDGDWMVVREFAIEERLADALVQAASEEERVAVRASIDDASTTELFGALVRRAEQRQLEGDASRSLEILDLARGLAEQMGDEVQVARTLASIGRYHERRGEFGAALDSYTEALSVPGAFGDTDGRADALSVVGSIHSRRGDYRLAMDTLQESLSLRQAAGHQVAIGPTLSNLGSIHLVQGDYEQAVTYYQQALALAEKLDDTGLAARVLSNLGAIEHERGNYERALAHYEQAVALGEAIGRPTLAILLSNIGLVHRLQGLPDLAREYLTRSLRMSEETGDKDLTASTLLNLGMVERYQGRLGRALEYYEQSLALREAAGQKWGVALALNSIGLLHDREGRPDRALEYYRRSLAISEQLGSDARIAQTLANVANAHYARREYAQALAAAERAVDVAREIGHSGEALWTSLAAMGRVQRRLGQPERARARLEDSVAALEQMRAEAGGSAQEQQGFLESRLLAYEEMTDLLVTEGDPVGALAFAERAKARVLLDVLQRGRVNITKAMTADERTREDRFRAELSTLNGRLRRERGRAAADRAGREALEADVRRARLGYEAFQTSLYAAHPELKVRRGEAPLFDAADARAVLPDARTAALEFMVSEEQTLLFVLTREPDAPSATLRVHRLPVTRGQLAELVSELRSLITTRNLRVREHASRLFHLLLAPAAAELAGKSALLIVPDGILWELPFQALQPAAGRYLIEDFAISYAPSLTVLRETQRLTRPVNRAAPRTLLAFGNPDLGAASQEPSDMRLMGGGLNPLPEAERQVELLSQLYGEDQSRTYIGAAAREGRVKAEAHQYRILHLATHGVLDDQSPMNSYVVLSQTDPSDEEDGLLEAWELMDLDLDADLVVLSACETGRGRFGPGEGVIGMSWAAFVAGSPAAVVSLWKVEAQSTTELMVEFHRQLLADPEPPDAAASKAEALQRAALRFLEDSRYRHPFYWAGFVLVGNAAPLSPFSGQP